MDKSLKPSKKSKQLAVSRTIVADTSVHLKVYERDLRGRNMARIKAHQCACECKMKRLYVRAEGGTGWEGIGWICFCGCGCIKLDEGEWNVADCDTSTCGPVGEKSNSCC